MVSCRSPSDTFAISSRSSLVRLFLKREVSFSMAESKPSVPAWCVGGLAPGMFEDMVGFRRGPKERVEP